VAKTVPAIRVTENNDDIIIKIDKEMLREEFENHPEIIFEHASEELIQQVKINDNNAFFQKYKEAMIYGVKVYGDSTTLLESFIEDTMLLIWQCGEADFIEECKNSRWKSRNE